MACRGVLFAITDEQAKRLLAASGDEAVIEIVDEIEEAWDEENLQYMDKSWDAIHRCLSDGSLNLEAGKYPLNQCILGGTQLHESDEWCISFVTAAAVRYVASALTRITRDWFRQRYFELVDTDYPKEYIGEDDFEYSWEYLEGAKAFYQKAAQANRAVIFMVDQ